MTQAADKLSRIEGQIAEAKSEIDTLQGQIQSVDDRLSTELSEINYDAEKVATMEGEREELLRSQKRLDARVQALQSTVAETEKDVARAELKSAIKAHAKSIDEVNGALKSYVQGLELLHAFVKLYRGMIDHRIVEGDLRDKVHYYSELLHVKKPELKTANSLTGEEDRERADILHKCIPMRSEIDPYRSNPWKAKLDELTKKKREAEQVIKAKKAREEAVLAG